MQKCKNCSRVCVRIIVHTVVHNTAQSSSDYISSYPPDKHQSSDAVYWREGATVANFRLPMATNGYYLI